jgi:hypothetical protein
MIGHHPQTFGLPELNLFNVSKLRHLWRRMADDFGERHGLLRTVAEIYAGEQSSDTIIMANHWAAAREENDVADVYKELAAKIDPLIPVEKSPAYTFTTQRMIRIYEAFPDARFIHLVRHPIPQCKSVMKLKNGVFALVVNAVEFKENRAFIEPQIAWHNLNINIMNFLDGLPAEQQMRLRGEDFMEGPEQHLKAICRWLGIRDDDDAIDEMLHPERSPFACFGPVTAMFGNDPNFLRGPSFRKHTPQVPSLDEALPWRDDGNRLYPEVIALAQEFGYE